MKSDNKYCDLSKLITMLDGDMDSVKEMVYEYLESIPGYFEDALDAYEKNDLVKLKGILHKLKGNISMIANDQITADIVSLHASAGTDQQKLTEGMEGLKNWFPVLCEELKAESGNI